MNSIAQRIKDLHSEAQDIVASLTEGVHYFVTESGVRVLKKGGAEIISRAMGYKIHFSQPCVAEAIPGDPESAHAVAVCSIETESGVFVSEGAGAYPLKHCDFNLNTAAKMAAKSAHIDAVIRAAGLSALVSQDVDTKDVPDPLAISGMGQQRMSSSKAFPAQPSAQTDDSPARGELIKAIENVSSDTKRIAAMMGVDSLDELGLDDLKTVLAELEEDHSQRSEEVYDSENILL
jgi:hypothetical protein